MNFKLETDDQNSKNKKPITNLDSLTRNNFCHFQTLLPSQKEKTDWQPLFFSQKPFRHLAKGVEKCFAIFAIHYVNSLAMSQK
uniref:Uncharacterized protein n=1 Tax=Romanomermis culicivorax TaxID=13658 RepID=A0A915L223_ROMCU